MRAQYSQDDGNAFVLTVLAMSSTNPLVRWRLEYCVEFTKPDALCIRLMGTPKNHRSPPA